MLLFSYDYPPTSTIISRQCSAIARKWHERIGTVCVLTAASATRPHAHAADVQATWELRVTHRWPRREVDAWRFLSERRPLGPVVCGSWYPEGLVAMLAGVRPRVILAHGSEIGRLPPLLGRLAWRHVRRRVLESADLVIASSRYTRDLVTAAAPRARATAIPPGVDLQRFAGGGRQAARRRLEVERKVVLSSVSPLDGTRGHDMVLKAIARLRREERRRVTYLVAGEGPEQARLRTLAAALGIHSQVRWLGPVEDDERADVYRASDLFILCAGDGPQGDVEGFGMPLLEAMACGVPVVGSRSGGIPDAVPEGEGGWLVRNQDIDGLMAIISRLVRHPGMYLDMGRRAREHVEQERTWDQYMRRFTAALTDGRIPVQ